MTQSDPPVGNVFQVCVGKITNPMTSWDILLIRGSEIRRSPVDNSKYPTIYMVSYMLGGCCGFLNHQQ